MSHDSKTDSGQKLAHSRDSSKSEAGSHQKSAQEDGRSPVLNWLIIFGTIGIVVAVLFLVIGGGPSPKIPEAPAPTPTKPKQLRSDMMGDFLKGLTELQTNFPSQDEKVWQILRAEGKRVLRDDKPERPAVLLFPVTQHTAATAHCFLSKLADVITASYPSLEPVVIDAREIGRESTSGQVKLYIDEELTRGFEAGGKVGTVLHLDKVHPEAAMILQGFADDDNAPYKDAFILLTVEVRDLPEGDRQELKKSVYDQMREMWSALEDSNYSPLMGRIAKCMVFLNIESNLSDCYVKKP